MTDEEYNEQRKKGTRARLSKLAIVMALITMGIALLFTLYHMIF